MLIFSGVVAAAYTVLIAVQRQSSGIQARELSVGNARVALAQMDRQIRSGNVLYDPATEVLPLSMRVYTQANGDERCVQWQVFDGTLRTRSWSPSWRTDGKVSGWTTVAHGLRNTTSPFSLQGGSTPYSSRLVDIRLLVRGPRSGERPTEVQTSLSGRNTLYGYDPGVCSPAPTA